MELGISPIITSSLVIQLLSGSKLIEVDQSVKEDRQLMCAASRQPQGATLSPALSRRVTVRARRSCWAC